MNNPDSNEYAEKCVEAFNNLTETIIYEICKKIIYHVKNEEAYEGFELPSLDNPLDILNYCWFTTLYTCAITDDNDIAYIVEGEGDWGNLIGFAIKNNIIIHVGDDCYDYMESDYWRMLVSIMLSRYIAEKLLEKRPLSKQRS